MARGLKVWVGATLIACGVIALVYLPPRGDRANYYRRTFSLLANQSPARRRVQELAEQWRSAQAALRLAEERERFQRGVRGPTLVLVGGGEDAVRSRLAAELDSVWKALGLAETKIAVGFVIDWAAATPLSAFPREEGWEPAYLLPDSVDRTMCVVRTPVNAYWGRILLKPRTALESQQIRQWLKSNLGPCAFFAAYGAPGRAVRHWLDQRSFDLAMYPEWDVVPRPNPRESGLALWQGPGRRFWWDYIYHQSPAAIACLGARVEGCREAVLAGAGGEAGSGAVGRFITTERTFWRRQRLMGGTHYLADVVRELGRDRFLEFWNSPLPADTALAAALREPVGQWTEAWQHRFAARIPLGPQVPFTASLLALLLAAAAIGCIAVTVRRRQVLLVVIALAAFPAVLRAQGNRWERQVRDQLNRAVAVLPHSPAEHRVLGIGPLNTGESDSFPVALKAGQSYDVVAVCDDDCTSLHLRLTNASGSDMAVDRSGENLPVLRFTPSQSGLYRVGVAMAVCRQNPCWYGLAMTGQ
jgi:hypothetical protein